jgi:anti-sigma regulatory factor (Ser/Thr protein kinase)
MKLILSEEHNACTSQLCQIRAKVRDACELLGFPITDINVITLAIDEACTNIIRYAYGGKAGRIVLTIYQKDEEAVFLLQDFAECIDETCIEMKKKSLLEPGGLGLKLIYQIMDSVELLPSHDQIGNILELKKHLPKGL